MNLVEFKDVSFSYGEEGCPVLDGVSFSLREGELVALIGNNGSGKSTIAKLIDGFLVPDSGTVRAFNSDVGAIDSREDLFALRRNVGFVFQNPDDQMVASLVIDEIGFGPANLGVDASDAIMRIDDALKATNMGECVGRDVNELSGGQKQKVAIGDALAMRPRLLLLDEATSMLDESSRNDIFEIVRQQCAKGMTALMITHDPKEAAQADRVLEMRDGRVIEFPQNPSREISSPFKHPARISETASKAADTHIGDASAPAIQFKDVTFSYSANSKQTLGFFAEARTPSTQPVLQNVNLTIYAGDFLVITGANGCGKSTLVQHMNGLLTPTQGEVLIYGRSTSTKAGANAARRNVGLCFQYPERALFAQSVHDDVAFGPRSMGLTKDEANERARKAMEAVSLPYERFAETSPFELSGGEQRKVALAGVLAMHPQVLVLDEPCAGLDPNSQERLLTTLAHMHANGQTIVMVTHNLNDVQTLESKHSVPIRHFSIL